ncbi:MAG: hypothetical protein KC731_14810 [Myxococcales bacterium]|nr:hypothetical protein [Myxococcales bacterium]
MATLTCPAEGPDRDGVYRLVWTAPEGQAVELVEHHAGRARTIYAGRDRAATVTGRHGGDYRYALVVDGGAAAPDCLVTVEPHSLPVAFGFFTVGLAVTLLTVTMVVRGHRAHRRGLIG